MVPLDVTCGYDSSFTRSWRVVDTNYFDTVWTYNIFLKSKIMKATMNSMLFTFIPKVNIYKHYTYYT